MPISLYDPQPVKVIEKEEPSRDPFVLTEYKPPPPPPQPFATSAAEYSMEYADLAAPGTVERYGVSGPRQADRRADRPQSPEAGMDRIKPAGQKAPFKLKGK